MENLVVRALQNTLLAVTRAAGDTLADKDLSGGFSFLDMFTRGNVKVNHTTALSLSAVFNAVDQISNDIAYFSILRRYSELEIVRRFSSLTEFHHVYSSCNRNFHMEGSRIDGRWCLDCPKCRFAALSLALFLTPAEVQSIQGGNLLDRGDQADGFRALCGLGQDKPFECVGEAGESRAALAALAQERPWKDLAVVRAIAPELKSVKVPDMDELLKPSGEHSIPASILAALWDSE